LSAPSLISRGMDVIRFDAGEPDFPTPAHITDAAVRALREGFTHYTSSRGLPTLRKALANRYAEAGQGVREENIVLFPGAKMALFAVLSVLVSEGQEVLIPEPGWPTYSTLVRFLGGVPVHIPTSLEQNFLPNPEEFRSRVSPQTRAVVINTPCNPTGRVYPPGLLDSLVEICERHDLILISDEIYASLTYEGRRAPSPLRSPETDRIVVINGFSKEFAMTGWRLGYSVASRHLSDLLAKVQENTTTCPSSFVQKAAESALSEPREWFDQMLAEYQARRDLMVEGLNSIRNWECLVPQGTFYCFPRIGNMDSRKFSSRLLEKEGVSTVPGREFGISGEHHLRLCFAQPASTIRRGIERIRRFVESGSGGPE